MAKKAADPFAAMGKKAEKSKKAASKVTVDTTDLVNRAKNKQKVYKKEKFTEPEPIEKEAEQVVKEPLVKVQAGLNKDENSIIRGIKQALFEMDDNRNCTNAEAVKVAIRAFDVDNKDLIIKLFNAVKADDGRTKKK